MGEGAVSMSIEWEEQLFVPAVITSPVCGETMQCYGNTSEVVNKHLGYHYVHAQLMINLKM